MLAHLCLESGQNVGCDELRLAPAAAVRQRRPTFLGRSRTLTERFCGLRAYPRAPAAGLWQDGEQTLRDDVVVYEVGVEDLDRVWWAGSREELRQVFGQDGLVVGAQAVEVR